MGVRWTKEDRDLGDLSASSHIKARTQSEASGTRRWPQRERSAPSAPAGWLLVPLSCLLPELQQGPGALWDGGLWEKDATLLSLILSIHS